MQVPFPCECSREQAAELCPIHKIRMAGRRHSICRGERIDPDKRLMYLAMWTGGKNDECKHRGSEKLRDEECIPCSAAGEIKLVSIYPCALHRECTIIPAGLTSKGISCCAVCTDRE